MSQPNVLTTTKTWHTVEMLCDRFELNFSHVKRDIRAARVLAQTTFSEDDKSLAKANLLCLAKDLEGRARWKELPAFFAFVRVCFSTLITSVVIEALFSQYDGLKGKGNMRRSTLSDDHALDALLAREAKDIVEDVMCPFRAAPELSFVLALSHRLAW